MIFPFQGTFVHFPVGYRPGDLVVYPRSELPAQLSEWPKDGIQIPGFSGVFLPYGETAQDMAKVKLQFLHP